MGFRISWLAVEGLRKAELIAALGFSETGIKDEANEAPFSAADLGTEWSMIWSNDFEWSVTKPLKGLPELARSIACQIHEGVMYSAARCVLGDKEIWSVTHNAQVGVFNLTVDGEAPAELSSIHENLLKQQNAEGGEGGEVDFIFDVPLELAASITGFKHDEWDLRTGPRPDFTVVNLGK